MPNGERKQPDQLETGNWENFPGSEPERYNILMVEDELDDRKLAFQALRKSPFVNDIRCFASGDQLMDFFVNEGFYSGNLMSFMPTIILLDIHVPGTDGLEILKKIRGHPSTADMPVVIITGDTSKALLEKARRLKANAFVSKPLNLDQIHQVIYTGWGWPKGIPP